MGWVTRQGDWRGDDWSPIQLVMTDELCCLSLRQRRHLLVVDNWWGFFSLGYVSLFLIPVFALIDESADAYIRFWFVCLFVCLFVFFFFFNFIFRICGFPTICWVCHMLFFFFFRLGLLSYLLFRIDVGLWVVGLLCYNIYIYIF